ncbi:hypothetical protein ABK040_003851 [Willaertia magna]
MSLLKAILEGTFTPSPLHSRYKIDESKESKPIDHSRSEECLSKVISQIVQQENLNFMLNIHGFDKFDVVEVLEKLGIGMYSKLNNVNIEALECEEQEKLWAEKVIKELKNLSEEAGTDVIFGVLKHCSQKQIEVFMNEFNELKH